MGRLFLPVSQFFYFFYIFFPFLFLFYYLICVSFRIKVILVGLGPPSNSLHTIAFTTSIWITPPYFLLNSNFLLVNLRT